MQSWQSSVLQWEKDQCVFCNDQVLRREKMATPKNGNDQDLRREKMTMTVCCALQIWKCLCSGF
ncbi:hypothetical protein SOVF_004970 [Spinacia oleracea]|nr:hypothetical protein SOVF_004970 [Spinacia oleracea]